MAGDGAGKARGETGRRSGDAREVRVEKKRKHARGDSGERDALAKRASVSELGAAAGEAARPAGGAGAGSGRRGGAERGGTATEARTSTKASGSTGGAVGPKKASGGKRAGRKAAGRGEATEEASGDDGTVLPAFREWLSARGVEVNDDLMRVEERAAGCSGFALRCVANRDVEAGSLLARVPKRALLSCRTGRARRLIRRARLGGGLGLIFATMFERRLGERSRWWGYLRSIPEAEYLPFLWKDAELARLAGTDLEAKVEEDRQLMREDFEQSVLPLPRPRHAADRSPWTYSEFQSAASVVASRSFGVDERHGDAMVPVADLFNHKVSVVELSPEFQVFGDESDDDSEEEDSGPDEEGAREREGEGDGDDDDDDDDDENDDEDEEEEGESSDGEPEEAELIGSEVEETSGDEDDEEESDGEESGEDEGRRGGRRDPSAELTSSARVLRVARGQGCAHDHGACGHDHAHAHDRATCSHDHGARSREHSHEDKRGACSHEHGHGACGHGHGHEHGKGRSDRKHEHEAEPRPPAEGFLQRLPLPTGAGELSLYGTARANGLGLTLELGIVDADEDEDALAIVAASAVARGEEIHNTYGELGNTELALKYGFALPENPLSTVRISRAELTGAARATLGGKAFAERAGYLQRHSELLEDEGGDDLEVCHDARLGAGLFAALRVFSASDAEVRAWGDDDLAAAFVVDGESRDVGVVYIGKDEAEEEGEARTRGSASAETPAPAPASTPAAEGTQANHSADVRIVDSSRSENARALRGLINGTFNDILRGALERRLARLEAGGGGGVEEERSRVATLAASDSPLTDSEAAELTALRVRATERSLLRAAMDAAAR